MLQAFLNYIKIYRPLNLIFIAAAQLLAGYYLYLEADFKTLVIGKIQWYILGTFYVAAFGYWVNDFYDKGRDAFNKPHKMGVIQFPNWFIFFHLALFSVLAAYCGWMINLFFFNFFIVSLFLIWLYSFRLKDLPLIGNIIIAFFSFISIFGLKWLLPEINFQLLVHFALMAGLINLTREIVKDSEDLEGDKQFGARTYPIVFGQEANKKLANLIIVFCLSFIIISVYYQQDYFKLKLKLLYIGYYVVFIVYPMYYFITKLYRANKKEDFTALSRILKYVLYTGILSIFFF